MNRRCFLKAAGAVSMLALFPISIAGADPKVSLDWRITTREYQRHKVAWVVNYRRPCDTRGYEQACWIQFDRDYYEGKSDKELIARAEETYPREEV